jgi:hypothetical protein
MLMKTAKRLYRLGASASQSFGTSEEVISTWAQLRSSPEGRSMADLPGCGDGDDDDAPSGLSAGFAQDLRAGGIEIMG